MNNSAFDSFDLAAVAGEAAPPPDVCCFRNSEKIRCRSLKGRVEPRGSGP